MTRKLDIGETTTAPLAVAGVACEAPLPNGDGRQSAMALAIQRGAQRVLLAHGFTSVLELPLANGRRADIVAVDAKSEVWIVEVKSSIEDFRSDTKWPEYRDYCDRLWFAVAPDFPVAVLPPDVGLIVADRYGGDIVHASTTNRLPPLRRKAVVHAVARCAALRLQLATDPELRQSEMLLREA